MHIECGKSFAKEVPFCNCRSAAPNIPEPNLAVNTGRHELLIATPSPSDGLNPVRVIAVCSHDSIV